MPILLRNVDQKLIGTVFLIAICHHTGDKWQSKTLFLSIFDPRSWIVDSFLDCCLPGVLKKVHDSIFFESELMLNMPVNKFIWTFS